MEIVKTIINSFEFQTIIKLLLGIILAGIIGLERSSWSKPAGFRTHALVGISAVLVMICGEYMSKSFGVTANNVDAVVKPFTLKPSRNIVPAPKNPIPDNN